MRKIAIQKELVLVPTGHVGGQPLCNGGDILRQGLVLSLITNAPPLLALPSVFTYAFLPHDHLGPHSR